MGNSSYEDTQKQAAERAERASRERADRAAAIRRNNTEGGSNMPIVGAFLLVIGALTALYFLFVYDTSVLTDPRYIEGRGAIAGERVHNQGLMQNRLLGSIGGMLVAAIGSGMLIVGKRNT